MNADQNADSVEVLLESDDFPCDALRIRRLTGREAISRAFSFDLEVVSMDRAGVDADSMAGASVTLRFLRQGAEVRRLHGMILTIRDLLAGRADFRTYELRVVPRLLRLSLVQTLEIFMAPEGATAPTAGITMTEIVSAKLKNVGLDADLELRLTGPQPRREFVVQYKEADVDFIARLTEHLGVSFFFSHEGDRDVLVLTDHNGGFPRLGEAARFNGRGEQREVFDLEVARTLVPHAYVMRDYDYRNPLLDLTSDPFNLEIGHAGGVVEYGAHFRTKEEGNALARVRAEERQAGHLVYTGKSDLSTLGAGMRFNLEGHPDLGALDLLLVEVEHEAVQAVGGEGGEERPHYLNTFRAIPADRTYRPPRTTPRPQIHGLITGVIDAWPTGVETVAQLDEQGRYRVRFIFDVMTPGGRPASHPVRMVQNHAGQNYGTHFPLKPGVEVVMAFIDGDPDRPIIVGAVPNPATPSPVDIRKPTLHRIKTGAGITIDLLDD